MRTGEVYALDSFVEDLRAIAGTARSHEQRLARLGPFVLRFALSKSWVSARHYETTPEQGNGVHLLHEEPDRSLAVAAVSWLPGYETPPHDHGTWAVVAAVEGRERNTFWKRVDDRTREGYAKLDRVGGKALTVGDVLAMPVDTIHSVANDTNEVTLTLHVYGTNLQYCARSQFDLEQNSEAPRRTVWTSS